MKTLGIIGGIGPESTIEYYRYVIEGYRARAGDQNYPHIIINSISVWVLLGLVTAHKLEELADFLTDEIQKLENAGAEVGLVASNTPHIVFDELRRRSKLPLVSIVEATRDEVANLGMTKVGLFGTKFTMQGGFYQSVFADGGLSLVLPNEADQEYIHQKYIGELVNNIIKPETRDELLEIVDRMQASDGIEAIILGGTELPLILMEDAYHDIPLLDTGKIHAAAAVEQMF